MKVHKEYIGLEPEEDPKKNSKTETKEKNKKNKTLKGHQSNENHPELVYTIFLALPE